MRRSIHYILAAIAVLVLCALAFLAFYIPTLAPRLKQRVIVALQDRFDANVQLKDLRLSIFPSPSVDCEELVIKHRQWDSDAHPLIKIARFHADTDYITLLDWRNRVDNVTLQGLEIHVPPRGTAAMNATNQPGHDTARFKFLIQTIVANNALVEIEPKDPHKDPLQFPIEKLVMHSVGPGEAMLFTASLTNAKPPGRIDTSGHFGPWQRDDPRATPISGDYTFKNANLSVFNGIKGTLASTGRYGGILQNIKINGVTDTPDFSLKPRGAPVHLTTRFHAIVDGTNGDTVLDPVQAKFGHSEFLCKGGIVRRPGEQGKTIQLYAQTTHGRIEDILSLVIGGAPVVDGEVKFQSSILIPPVRRQIVEKLKLDGQFHLISAHFTNPQVAKTLNTLANRASGISKEREERGEGLQGNVASDLDGKFKLENASLNLEQLVFELPGADLQLAGKFNLDSSKVDMKGVFQMRARLSQTQSGIKQVLLKPIDPLFEKGGAGFEVPISVTGTKDQPNIGVSAFHHRFNLSKNK